MEHNASTPDSNIRTKANDLKKDPQETIVPKQDPSVLLVSSKFSADCLLPHGAGYISEVRREDREITA